ncbi:hypothetical protein GCM10009526_30290 [Glutamicibacter creatinolyticus]
MYFTIWGPDSSIRWRWREQDFSTQASVRDYGHRRSKESSTHTANHLALRVECLANPNLVYREGTPLCDVQRELLIYPGRWHSRATNAPACAVSL